MNRRLLTRMLAGLLTAAIVTALLPIPGVDSSARELMANLRCPPSTRPAVDHGWVIEEVNHAHAWNRLLAGSPLATLERGGYFSVENVLAMVDSWMPLIRCIAREFRIPPELLAGVLATELDLDYHVTDAIVDTTIRTNTLAGYALCLIAIGGGYGGVHTSHLKPALATLGDDFSTTAFYRVYYRLLASQNYPDLTQVTTNSLVIDLANTAVMARYYALLRLGARPLDSLTVTDMAFVWSAYRGGVAATPADPDKGSRWSLDYLQKANDPWLFGDTIIALPYFSYYWVVSRAGAPNEALSSRKE